VRFAVPARGKFFTFLVEGKRRALLGRRDVEGEKKKKERPPRYSYLVLHKGEGKGRVLTTKEKTSHSSLKRGRAPSTDLLITPLGKGCRSGGGRGRKEKNFPSFLEGGKEITAGIVGERKGGRYAIIAKEKRKPSST